MIAEPSLPASPYAATDASPQRYLASSVCTWALIGACVAMALYALAVFTDFGIPLVYSFPTFYPLQDIVDFDVLYGFCIQCVLYGVVIGAFAHARQAKRGAIAVVVLHAISVVLSPMLTSIGG